MKAGAEVGPDRRWWLLLSPLGGEELAPGIERVSPRRNLAADAERVRQAEGGGGGLDGSIGLSQ